MSAPLTTRIPIKDGRGNTIDEKEVATYAGLLSRAHEEGLVAICTVLLQVPGPDNGMTAIATAAVETGKGKFTGIGDASPDNVNKRIAPHIIRMAETRAKARALRDAVNIGVVCLEELGGGEGEAEPLTEPEVFPRGNTQGREDNVRRLPPRAAREPEPRREERRPPENNRNGWGQGFVPITENQRKYLFRMLAGRGVEGKAANDAICEAAGVTAVGQISKTDASRLIDAWVREAQDGAA